MNHKRIEKLHKQEIHSKKAFVESKIRKMSKEIVYEVAQFGSWFIDR